MPRRIEPTKKGVTLWVIHFIVYAIAIFCMWFFTYHGKTGFIYPWPIWATCAWGLALGAHACVLWSNYEDKSFNEFRRQTLE